MMKLGERGSEGKGGGEGGRGYWNSTKSESTLTYKGCEVVYKSTHKNGNIDDAPIEKRERGE